MRQPEPRQSYGNTYKANGYGNGLSQLGNPMAVNYNEHLSVRF